MDLIVGKYGKKYDLTIARRSFAGKDFVSLNVMWCGTRCCRMLPHPSVSASPVKTSTENSPPDKQLPIPSFLVLRYQIELW